MNIAKRQQCSQVNTVMLYRLNGPYILGSSNGEGMLAWGRDGEKHWLFLSFKLFKSSNLKELQYADAKVIGNGSFGVVYRASLV
jgi:hypothetical protein